MDAIKKTKGGRTAFTLIELLAVLVIMAVMMSIAVSAFMGMGRGAGMRRSALDLQSWLNYTRQRAITMRVRTCLTYSNLVSETDLPRGYCVITTNGVLVGNTNLLSEGIIFTNPTSDSFEFTLDGSCSGSAVQRTITLIERDAGKSAISNLLSVSPLSGRVKGASY